MTLENIQTLRNEFPILNQDLIYLDSAASTQKPRCVIERMSRFYEKEYANVHRGAYTLSHHASELYEKSRAAVAHFLGAQPQNIFFTRGTTAGINVLARGLENTWFQEGDLVVITRMEHHANFVPWQELVRRKGGRLGIIEMGSDFRLDPASVNYWLSQKPKIFSFTAMSNVLGTVNPIEDLSKRAKKSGAMVIVDGAQAAAHFPLKMAEWPDVDFLVLSAHKIWGPTGIGAVCGTRQSLENLNPVEVGGGMISQVMDDLSQWNEIPWRFEAGTPPISEAVGWKEALNWIQEKGGVSAFHTYEQKLSADLLGGLLSLPKLTLVGPADLKDRGPVFSFSLSGIHPHDVATFLDSRGIAVRAGHHCAQPLFRTAVLLEKKIQSCVRVSLTCTTTTEEISVLLKALKECREFFERQVHHGK